MKELDLVEKKISSVVFGDFPPFRFTRDRVLLPNGEIREKCHVCHPGGVAVLAVDGEKRIAMVRQYRYAVGEFLDEIPAGKLDKIPGETIEHGALRELREETGMTASTLIYLGYIFPSPGIIDEKLRLFYATDLAAGEQELDEDEFINVGWWTVERLEEAIRKGEMVDVKTLCAFQMARSRGLV